MFEVIEKWTGDGVIALRAIGKLRHEDYEELVPRLLEEIEKHGALRCLVDVTGLEGFEPRAVLDELAFDLKHGSEVSRCAVVGNRTWERWATKIARPVFPKAEIAYFEADQLEQAAAWIREGLPSAPSPERA